MPRQAGSGPLPTDKHVGAEIARRRLIQGLNQSELGRHLGVTFQQIQKYEKGTNRVSASKLELAAAALGCEIGDFFPRKGADEASVEAHSGFFTLRGSAALAKAYEALQPAQRKLLLALAAELLPRAEGEAEDPAVTAERYGTEEQLRAG
jgi:transcriptional regulator with XRE-family HTH domain